MELADTPGSVHIPGLIGDGGVFGSCCLQCVKALQETVVSRIPRSPIPQERLRLLLERAREKEAVVLSQSSVSPHIAIHPHIFRMPFGLGSFADGIASVEICDRMVETIVCHPHWEDRMQSLEAVEHKGGHLYLWGSILSFCPEVDEDEIWFWDRDLEFPAKWKVSDAQDMVGKEAQRH